MLFHFLNDLKSKWVLSTVPTSLKKLYLFKFFKRVSLSLKNRTYHNVMNKKYVEDKLLILSYKKEDRYIYYIIII